MTYLLNIDRLTKNYGALRVTDKLNLQLMPGELHAIIGPNGAGKTTLINQISGELASDKGSIQFAGEEIAGNPIHLRARSGLVRSYQITSIFEEFTVEENVALAARGSRKHGFSLWKALLDDQEVCACAHEAIKSVGLTKLSSVPASDLGYGERRQLELAMALAMNPRFLLLDEPMAGMSVQESQEVVSLLQRLKGRYTILLVEHDMNAVFALADRISVLVYGRIMITGTPEEIRANEEVRAIYLGDEEIGAT